MKSKRNEAGTSGNAPVTLAQTWRPKLAWFFFGGTILISNAINSVLYVAERKSPAFYTIRREPVGLAMAGILSFALIFVVSLYFANPKSLADFAVACRLRRPTEQEILQAVTAGVLIQFVGIYIFQGTLSQIRAARAFNPMMIALLLAPFFEEPAMRGFAYQAFRNSYSVAVSTCFVVIITLVFHWGQIHRSVYQFVVITIVNVALCLLKERHSSLWSCIACHFAFNASYVCIYQ